MSEFLFKTIPKAAERFLKHQIMAGLSRILVCKKKSAANYMFETALFVVPENALGDMIAKVALLETLKASRPEAQLDVLVVTKMNAEVLQCHPAVRDLFACHAGKKTGARLLWLLVRFAMRLRKKKYDLVICPVSGNLRYALFSWLVKARLSLCLRNAHAKPDYSKTFFNDAFTEDNLHFVAKHQQLGAYVAGPHAVLKSPAIHLSADERTRAAAFLTANGLRRGHRLIGVHPFYGPPRRAYPLEKYQQAFDLIQKRAPHAKLVVVLGPAEMQGRAEINSLADRAVTVAVPDIRQLAAILENFRLFICCDTGTMHLACSLGVPVLATWGSSDLQGFAPWSARSQVIQSPTDFAHDISPETIAGHAAPWL